MNTTLQVLPSMTCSPWIDCRLHVLKQTALDILTSRRCHRRYHQHPATPLRTGGTGYSSHIASPVKNVHECKEGCWYGGDQPMCYRSNKVGVFQLVGEGDKPIEPVRSPLMQPHISSATHPTGVHHIWPEELEVAGETLGLQLQLIQQPTCIMS